MRLIRLCFADDLKGGSRRVRLTETREHKTKHIKSLREIAVFVNPFAQVARRHAETIKLVVNASQRIVRFRRRPRRKRALKLFDRLCPSTFGDEQPAQPVMSGKGAPAGRIESFSNSFASSTSPASPQTKPRDKRTFSLFESAANARSR